MPAAYIHTLGTALTAALVLFIIYRRFRRNFGRQPLRPKRMLLRIVLLSVIGLLLLPAALLSTETAAAITAGLVLGLGLGVWGANHTRFVKHQDALHYIPHTYTGMLVSALFLGRLIYRFVILSPMLFSTVASDNARIQENSLMTMQHNPVTLGIFFILIGYYVYYYARVLWESRHLKPGDYEQPAASS